jgi:hypothetical protein
MRDALPEFALDMLADGARHDVAVHVQGCEACRDELALIRQAQRVLVATPIIDAARIVAAIPRARRRASWHAPAWRIAASILVALGGVSYVVTRTQFASNRMDTASLAVPAAAAPTWDLGPTVSGRLSDLGDDDLDALLEQIKHLDAVTVVEPKAVIPVLALGGNQ